jgi:hypothetical protein
MAYGPVFMAANWRQANARRYIAVRDVGVDEPNNWSGRDVLVGEKFYRFVGDHHASDPLPGNVLLSEHGSYTYPFFEFPLEALAIWTNPWLLADTMPMRLEDT